MPQSKSPSRRDKNWIYQRIEEIKEIFDQRSKSEDLSITCGPGVTFFYHIYAQLSGDQVAEKFAMKQLSVINQFQLNVGPPKQFDLATMERMVTLRVWQDLNVLKRSKLSLPILTNAGDRDRLVHADPVLLSGSVAAGVISQNVGDECGLKFCLDAIEEKLEVGPHGLGFPWVDSAAPSKIQILQKKQKILNLGISHGLGGTVLFLSYLRKLGVLSPKQAALLQRLLKTFVEIPHAMQTRQFPPFYPQPYGLKTKNYSFPSGWCYGNAGIGFALLLGGDQKLRMFAEEVILKGTDKKLWTHQDFPETFCHGAAGIAQICLRHYLYTKNPSAWDHYLFWLRLLNRPPKSYDFLNRLDCPRVWHGTQLSGFLGIGLTLCSALTTHDFHWDRSYLLSPGPSVKI